MTTIERRLSALEAAAPTYEPYKVVFVPEDTTPDQAVADFYETSGLKPDDVRLMIVEFVEAPPRDREGRLIAPAPDAQSSP